LQTGTNREVIGAEDEDVAVVVEVGVEEEEEGLDFDAMLVKVKGIWRMSALPVKSKNNTDKDKQRKWISLSL
jgi:hypothetical protein